jgi:hypothetical protein
MFLSKILSIKIIGKILNTNTGGKKLKGELSQKTGNNFILTLKKYWNKTHRTKVGTLISRISTTNNRILLFANILDFIIPITIPTIKENTIDNNPMIAEMGNFSFIIFLTDNPLLIVEYPKSNIKKFFIALRYRLKIGSSRLYLFLIFIITFSFFI